MTLLEHTRSFQSQHPRMCTYIWVLLARSYTFNAITYVSPLFIRYRGPSFAIIIILLRCIGTQSIRCVQP